MHDEVQERVDRQGNVRICRNIFRDAERPVRVTSLEIAVGHEMLDRIDPAGTNVWIGFQIPRRVEIERLGWIAACWRRRALRCGLLFRWRHVARRLDAFFGSEGEHFGLRAGLRGSGLLLSRGACSGSDCFRQEWIP